jgi:enamine deaminase RidA (YjgF/YER057c/UK114 family)
MKKTIIDSDKLSKPLGPYSHGVKVRLNGATLLFLSGIVAFDANGRVVGKGDIKAQTKQVLENLKVILDAEGATFKDIVKITNYYMNYGITLIAEVRAQYFKDWNPASTEWKSKD